MIGVNFLYFYLDNFDKYTFVNTHIKRPFVVFDDVKKFQGTPEQIESCYQETLKEIYDANTALKKEQFDTGKKAPSDTRRGRPTMTAEEVKVFSAEQQQAESLDNQTDEQGCTTDTLTIEDLLRPDCKNQSACPGKFMVVGIIQDYRRHVEQLRKNNYKVDKQNLLRIKNCDLEPVLLMFRMFETELECKFFIEFTLGQATKKICDIVCMPVYETVCIHDAYDGNHVEQIFPYVEQHEVMRSYFDQDNKDGEEQGESSPERQIVQLDPLSGKRVVDQNTNGDLSYTTMYGTTVDVNEAIRLANKPTSMDDSDGGVSKPKQITVQSTPDINYDSSE